MWKPKVTIACIILMSLCVSCKQSCFDVITRHDVAYWSRYWSQKNPYGAIMEYSKKDSTLKYLDDSWIYENWNPAFWGLKFRISNDTLFEYVNRKDRIITYDSLPIVLYSKNKIIIKNKESELVTWHRLPTKFAKRAVDLMNTPGKVKLSALLKTHMQNEAITNITDATWKLYGYGDVATGMVQKSEALKRSWMNLVKFDKNGNMIGLSTGNELQSSYTISDSCIVFQGFVSSKRKENYDGKKLCDALPQCKRFKINHNWLQLFYNDSKNYLLFKVSNSTKLSKESINQRDSPSD